jgi:transitional endoplasmic reticulum ATPase
MNAIYKSNSKRRIAQTGYRALQSPIAWLLGWTIATLIAFGPFVTGLHAIFAYFQKEPGGLQLALLAILVAAYIVTPSLILINLLLARIAVSRPPSFLRDLYLGAVAREIYISRDRYSGFVAYLMLTALFAIGALCALRFDTFLAPTAGQIAAGLVISSGVALFLPRPARYASQLAELEDRWGLARSTLGGSAWSASNGQSHAHRQPIDGQAGGADTSGDMQAPVSARQPTVSFQQIAGMDSTKQRVRSAVETILDSGRSENRSAVDAARNGILLFGDPGNGKTIFAEAVAGEFQLPLIVVTYADVRSRWIGAEAEALSACFKLAIRSAPCVLFVDEIDSFLVDRSNFSGSNQESIRVTNLLLTQIVDLRRHGVVLMAATNFIDRLDAAAIREGRFDFKIEVPSPDLPARVGLFSRQLSKSAPHVHFDPKLVESVVARWDGFNVKRVQAVAEELGSNLAQSGATHVDARQIQLALRSVQGKGLETPAAPLPLSDLGVDDLSREALAVIAGVMRDPLSYEAMGAQTPTGVFIRIQGATSGAEVVASLAHAAGWLVETVGSADLMRDSEPLQKAWRQARDRRPCIVFVDSADPLLDTSGFARAAHFVPALARALDETRKRFKDVMFVLCASAQSELPAELAMPGRFAEVIDVRSAEICASAYIAEYLARMQIRLDCTMDDALQVIGQGASRSQVERTLQIAVNAAVVRDARRPDSLALEDLRRAAQRAA